MQLACTARTYLLLFAQPVFDRLYGQRIELRFASADLLLAIVGDCLDRRFRQGRIGFGFRLVSMIGVQDLTLTPLKSESTVNSVTKTQKAILRNC